MATLTNKTDEIAALETLREDLAKYEKSLIEKKDSPEKVKQSIKIKIADIRKQIREGKTTDREVTAKQLADSLLRSRKKFLEMSKKDFNGVLRQLAKKPEYAFLKGMTRQEVIDDIQRKAKPVGWRFKGRENFKTPTTQQVRRGRANGMVYYENRANRADVSQTKQLAKGGSTYAEGGYLGKSTEEVWNNWSAEQRRHFLDDHNVIYGRDKLLHVSQYRLDELPIDLHKSIESVLKKHLREGQYSKGGSTYAEGGEVAKSYLHLYKLTYPNGEYTVEAYDGDYMTPKEALEKMRISLRGLKSYKYSGASSDSANYKKWHHKKDIGYSNTEAWDEVFGSEKYAKGGSTYQGGGEISVYGSNGKYFLKRSGTTYGEPYNTKKEAELWARLVNKGDYKLTNQGVEYIEEKDRFAKGGSTYAEGGYLGKSTEEVWNNWSAEQRRHFLDDHNVIYGRDKLLHVSQYRLDELPIDLHKSIESVLKKHLREGQYSKGGSMKGEILPYCIYVTNLNNPNENSELVAKVRREGDAYLILSELNKSLHKDTPLVYTMSKKKYDDGGSIPMSISKLRAMREADFDFDNDEDDSYDDGITRQYFEEEAYSYEDGGEVDIDDLNIPVHYTMFEDEMYEYARGGHVSKGEMVWNKLSQSKRMEFLYKHFTPEITPRSQEMLVAKNWNFLPKNVKIKFEAIYANVENY